jgi:hypothetical protein
MVIRMMLLAVSASVLAFACPSHKTPVSGYVQRPADGTILFVYPKVLHVGGALVVQTRLSRTAGATQCISLIDPAGLEAEVSCGVVEPRRVVMRPTSPGLNTVRLELFIGERLGARRDEPVCVVGGEGDCEPAR